MKIRKSNKHSKGNTVKSEQPKVQKREGTWISLLRVETTLPQLPPAKQNLFFQFPPKVRRFIMGFFCFKLLIK